MISLPTIPSWVDDAVCASTDPTLFDQGSGAAAAKRICATCPVIDRCREYATQDPSLEGVWGGTTVAERREIRARLGTLRGSECGTLAGYKRHIAKKTPTCDACRKANAEYQRKKRSQHQPGTPFTSTHGTESGYRAHLRRQEDPCEECSAAGKAAARARRVAAKAKAAS